MPARGRAVAERAGAPWVQSASRASEPWKGDTEHSAPSPGARRCYRQGTRGREAMNRLWLVVTLLVILGCGREDGQRPARAGLTLEDLVTQDALAQADRFAAAHRFHRPGGRQHRFVIGAHDDQVVVVVGHGGGEGAPGEAQSLHKTQPGPARAPVALDDRDL